MEVVALVFLGVDSRRVREVVKLRVEGEVVLQRRAQVRRREVEVVEVGVNMVSGSRARASEVVGQGTGGGRLEAQARLAPGYGKGMDSAADWVRPIKRRRLKRGGCTGTQSAHVFIQNLCSFYPGVEMPS